MVPLRGPLIDRTYWAQPKLPIPFPSHFEAYIYVYSLLLDLEHRLLALLSLLCWYSKFHEGYPGRPKQLWEENVSQKSRWGMKENQNLLQKFKLSVPQSRELSHRAWKWSPRASDNADTVQWLITCPLSSCFLWGLWCSLNSHSLYSLFVLHSCGWVFCVCGMGIVIWRGITRWWKWRRWKIHEGRFLPLGEIQHKTTYEQG